MTNIGIEDFARKILIMRLAQVDSESSGLWSDRQVSRREEAKVDELVAKTLDNQKSLEF